MISSLYCICLKKIVSDLDLDKKNKLNGFKKDLNILILSDFFQEIVENSVSENSLRLSLIHELRDIYLFTKLLKCSQKRQKIIKIFQILMSKHEDNSLALELQQNFEEHVEKHLNSMDEIMEEENMNHRHLFLIDCGLRIGSFLSETGWLMHSMQFLSMTHRLIKKLDDSCANLLMELSCVQRLLHVQALFCHYKKATISSVRALALINELNNSCRSIPDSLLANLYHELSLLHFYRSEYDLSYEWSIKALDYLKLDTPDKICVDVLRQAAKSCVVKRKFQKASILINHAVKIADAAFGRHHFKYADVLLDKGFFLLNVDAIQRSVETYKEALEIKKTIFGEKNLHVTVAHEDLAYALYVFEYSSGNFRAAKEHIETSIAMMQHLVPQNELMIASAKRVKALILEEIALDNMGNHPDRSDYKGLLTESEKLHQSALELAREAFGEENVQTAKHYGNLGRLYQSMSKFNEAEKNHQRAITIKKKLLGDFDYEVGLSIGHLASLYNYHMSKYDEAEKLYLQSIEISRKLFGPSYSGLEYDYRGLLHVYESLEDHQKYSRFTQILDQWRQMRANNETTKPTFLCLDRDSTVEDVKRKFKELCANPQSISDE